MEVDEPGTSGGHRVSGRLPSQIREMTCRMGVLTRADGSAQWEQDQTVVLAAVNGPLATITKKERPSNAVIEVVLKPFAGIPGGHEKRLERQIAGVLTEIVHTALHPRMLIQVVLQVVHADGALLPVALNAAVAALLDAAIPMKGLLAAASAAFSSQLVVLMDPDSREEEDCRSLCTAVFPVRRLLDDSGSQETKVDDMTLCEASGLFSLQELQKLTHACRIAAVKVAQLHYLALNAREKTPS